MKLVPSGTSKRTGKTYNAFWSCDRTCGNTAQFVEEQTEDYGTGEDAPLEFQPEYPGTEKREKTGDMLIIEKLEAIDKRLTDMGKWLVENIK